MAASRPDGHDQHPAEHHRRQRRDLRFELQVLQPLLQSTLEIIGPLAGLGRVELRVGLAGLLLQLELLGAVVPVGDLLGEPVLDRDFGLGDELELGVPHLLEMFRHDMDDGIALGLPLDLAVDPRALGPLEDRIDAGLARGQGPVVEVGRVVDVAGRPVAVELDVEHALGNDATFARAGEARVLDRVLDVEQHARPGPGSRSSTSTVPRLSRSRWRSRVRSMTESSSGWPGQTKAASGWPCGATRSFSKAIRS